VTAAITSIGADAWTAIHYPHAVFDEQLQQWVSDAEIAEIPFTAFTSRPKTRQVTARLIVRRVRDANPDHVTIDAQGELFPVWRHHAVFTDSPLPMLTAEADHRRHAIIEQVIADLKNGPFAHLPSGQFAANSAWLVLGTFARLQPHPRRRRARLGLSRQGRHRDNPCPPDQRRRSRHPIRASVNVVAGLQGGGDSAGGDLQRREQRGGAVSHVVVAEALGQPGLQRQDRRGAIQRLDLGLLVHTQHDRVLRWRQVQARPHRSPSPPVRGRWRI
jgi:hypothetical protein